MSISQPNNQRLSARYGVTTALTFRAKLLLAMMLVVLAVTTTTVYLAEENRRANHQRYPVREPGSILPQDSRN